MKYEIIGSSSKGNCIVVEDMLMLDCGVSYAKIKPYLKKVKLIFISHIHKDHLLPTTIQKIAYNHPTIKFICGSREVVFKLTDNKILSKNIFFMDSNKWYSLGILDFRLEPVEHDAANHCIKFKINTVDKKGIYIVDAKDVKGIKAKNYDLYLIENNYQEEILNKHIQECEDNNQLVYLNRVKNTHLSKSQCDDFLIKNMGDNSTFEYIHKSRFNNTEDGEIE